MLKIIAKSLQLVIEQYNNNYFTFINLKDYLKNLLQKNYSDRESSYRTKEKEAYMYFVDFLDECEGWLIEHTCNYFLLLLLFTITFFRRVQ